MLFLYRGCGMLIYPDMQDASYKNLDSIMSRKFSSRTFGILQYIIPADCTYLQCVFNDRALVSKSDMQHILFST